MTDQTVSQVCLHICDDKETNKPRYVAGAGYRGVNPPSVISPIRNISWYLTLKNTRVHAATHTHVFPVRNRMPAIRLGCLSKGTWAAVMTAEENGIQLFFLQDIRGIWSYLRWLFLVMLDPKSVPESVGVITQTNVSVCVCLLVHRGCISICPIRIYTLRDSQYKSFYEHLYRRDGTFGTLEPAQVRLLHRCDSPAFNCVSNRRRYGFITAL